MKYGTEKETTTTDSNGSTLTIIKKWRDGEVMKTYRQVQDRVKVTNINEETAEYIKHTDRVREKKKLGLLVVKDEDKTLAPTFIIEYPKHDIDGSYFVVSSWTEFTDK
jgi:hypothetical protein